MITFSEDGKYALVANEGEPNPTYTIDPPGSISIIELPRQGAPVAVRHVGFERFDGPGQRNKLEQEGVRIFGPGASVAQDLEPEYVTVRCSEGVRSRSTGKSGLEQRRAVGAPVGDKRSGRHEPVQYHEHG
jgi:hypothetical protein